MPKPVMTRRNYNPYESFLTRQFSVYKPPQTPIVTLPEPRLPEALPEPPEARPQPKKPSILKLRELDTKEQIYISDIIEMVLSFVPYRRAEVLGKNRTKVLASTRQVIMWLSRRFAGRSLPQIGQKLGGRDHTTVMHGCQVIEKLIAANKLAPERDTTWEWANLLLRETGVIKDAESPPPIAAVGEQTLASGKRRGRPPKLHPFASIQSVDERGQVDGGNGGPRPGKLKRTIQAPDAGLSSCSEEAA